MLDWMLKMIKTPKTQMGVALTAILFTAFIHSSSIRIIELFLVSFISCVVFDLLFAKIKGINPFFPSAALVSALIITLLASPTLPLFYPLAASLFAMLSKNFLRINNKHIFNPAGFGIITGSIIFHMPVLWWGVSWQGITHTNIFLLLSFLVLLTPAYISLYRIRKYFIEVTFLIIYILLRSIPNHVFSFGILFDPALLFFVLVMLPEPMTTPSSTAKQTLFGAIVAISSIFIPFPTDPLISSLLLGNILFFFFR